MEVVLSLATGALFAAGTYMLLRRHLLRIVMGLILINNAVTLAVFTAGRLQRTAPPILPEGVAVDAANVDAIANPLSQALILTAIVIGFSFALFSLVVVFRVDTELGASEAAELQQAADDLRRGGDE